MKNQLLGLFTVLFLLLPSIAKCGDLSKEQNFGYPKSEVVKATYNFINDSSGTLEWMLSCRDMLTTDSAFAASPSIHWSDTSVVIQHDDFTERLTTFYSLKITSFSKTDCVMTITSATYSNQYKKLAEAGGTDWAENLINKFNAAKLKIATEYLFEGVGALLEKSIK